MVGNLYKTLIFFSGGNVLATEDHLVNYYWLGTIDVHIIHLSFIEHGLSKSIIHIYG